MTPQEPTPINDSSFVGAKVVLLCGERIVAYRRDRKPDIPYPGLWDLPGGGREGAEVPVDCIVREVAEEFGLKIDPARLHWHRRYESVLYPGQGGWFFAAYVGEDELASICFGPEGEEWAMVRIDEFLSLADAVPWLQTRLADYLASQGSA